MYLEQIDSPEDLKRLDLAVLPKVAEEIREAGAQGPPEEVPQGETASAPRDEVIEAAPEPERQSAEAPAPEPAPVPPTAAQVVSEPGSGASFAFTVPVAPQELPVPVSLPAFGNETDQEKRHARA